MCGGVTGNGADLCRCLELTTEQGIWEIWGSQCDTEGEVLNFLVRTQGDVLLNRIKGLLSKDLIQEQLWVRNLWDSVQGKDTKLPYPFQTGCSSTSPCVQQPGMSPILLDFYGSVIKIGRIDYILGHWQ